MNYSLRLTASFAFILFITCMTKSESTTFVNETFDDFAKGTLDASGENIYISRDGTIRTIHRYDFNGDGYLDLFFGNTHDIQSVVAPTVCTILSDRKISQSRLSIRGSDHVRVADLNCDGYADLVFSLNSDALQSSRRFLSIAYGGKDGFTSRRTNILPAINPVDITVTDLNNDNFPDIVVINDSYKPSGSSYITKENIRIYWGSLNGFLPTQYQDIAIPKKTKMVNSADVNGDGIADLIFLCGGNRLAKVPVTNKLVIVYTQNITKYPVTFDISEIPLPCSNATCIKTTDVDGNGKIDILIGTREDRTYLIRGLGRGTWDEPISFKSFPASQISVADMDADGRPDIIITNFLQGTASLASTSGADANSAQYVQLLWGSENGFSPDNSTKFDAKYASSTAIGDIDKDGKLDVAVAIYQDSKKQTFTAQSRIYFGKGKREFELSNNLIDTDGATDVALVHNDKSPCNVVFANSVAGTLFERIPGYLYYGDVNGFSVATRLELPGQSIHTAAGADFNADGFVDLVMTNTGHGGDAALRNPIVGANIYWGDANGLNLQKEKVLSEQWMPHCNVADLNRDGYLDLVLGGWDPLFGEDVGKPAEIAIYYGSNKGLDPADKKTLLCEGRSEGLVIADFNIDGYLDIAVTSYYKDCARIFWGSPRGFFQTQQQILSAPSPIGLESADLNSDGFLDLIICSYDDKANGYFDIGNNIFWGSKTGFVNTNSQWLPGNCNESPCVADWDKDGYLDIFFPSYHAQNTRESIPSYLYWGGQDGFDWQRRSIFICDSASDAFAGDFNHDGMTDLAVSCHTKYGDHHTNSKVFYNDGHRFENPRVQFLPTSGTHYIYSHDMGNIYNRQYQESYVSSIHTWKNNTQYAQLTCKVQELSGTKLEFFIRSSSDKDSLVAKQWQKVSTEKFYLDTNDRHLQYKAVFHSDNGDRYPILDSVIVTLSDN